VKNIVGNSTFVDYLRTHLSYESKIRIYAKRIVEDSKSLLRTFTPWRHLEKVPPPTIALETTNICNADCIFCGYQYQENYRTGQGVMSDAVFEDFVAQFKEMGGEKIDFTPLVGDALVDPKIIQRMKYATDKGFKIFVFTNGILFNRIDIEAFLNTGIGSISLSTAPFDKETYEKLYRTKHGKYEDMIQGVKKLLETRNKLNAKLKLTILFRSNMPYKDLIELPDYKNIILPLMTEREKKAVYVLTKGFDSWGGQIQKEDLEGIMEIAVPPLLKRRPCSWAFFPEVMWDGKVRACSCRFTQTENSDADDGLLIGDLNKSSLKDIVFGAEVKHLRQSFVDGNPPPVCQTCTMYKPC
jgi:sulfatase maturation enzyme AslB (radical SAM superfamily)